jgi:uncharacterized membrane protein (UPF0127 family)
VLSDADERVLAIVTKVPPCAKEPCPKYVPGIAVDKVIELRGGRAAELGVKVGEQVQIKFFNEDFTAHAEGFL